MTKLVTVARHARRSAAPGAHIVLAAALALTALLAAPPVHADLIAVGADFPQWKLPDHTGKEVSSTDLGGKSYLLWFYPKAMTPGCTAEGVGIRDRYDDFRIAGVEVLGVSFDSPKDNARFVEEEEFPFRLLTDDGTLASAVGAAESPDAKVARRVSYLIGPDGKVRQVYPSVVPADHAEQVLSDAAPSAPKP
jgi:thioredoxin-dependent peroxiredoxin